MTTAVKEFYVHRHACTLLDFTWKAPPCFTRTPMMLERLEGLFLQGQGEVRGQEHQGLEKIVLLVSEKALEQSAVVWVRWGLKVSFAHLVLCSCAQPTPHEALQPHSRSHWQLLAIQYVSYRHRTVRMGKKDNNQRLRFHRRHQNPVSLKNDPWEPNQNSSRTPSHSPAPS